MFTRWVAYDPDNCDEDDARIIEAYSARIAAEDYAERADSDSVEYTYAREGGVVMVRAEGSGGPWVRYEITAETIPLYHATEAKGGPCV